MMGLKIWLLLIALLANERAPLAQRQASSSNSSASSLLSAKTFAAVIDAAERVCRPRITCVSPRTIFAEENGQTAFTDAINEQNHANQSIFDLDDHVNNENVTNDTVDARTRPNHLVFLATKECEVDRRDYCAHNALNHKSWHHTMCKYCGIGNTCPSFSSPYTDGLTGRAIRDSFTINQILRAHNEVRSKIAFGHCDQPKAGCMNELQWDKELARVAQKWADQCALVDYKDDPTRRDPKLFHDPHSYRKTERFQGWRGVGQNVARDVARGVAGRFDVTKLVRHWLTQIKFFDPKGVDAFGTGNQCSATVGYYTQLVWQKTTHVGCGWTQFRYRGFGDVYENFLVCNYGPSGNIWDEKVYEKADKPCSCPCIGCKDNNGLCPPNCDYATWSTWGPWSSCSASCAGGTKVRRRVCASNSDPSIPTPYSSLILTNSDKFRGARQTTITLDPRQCGKGPVAQKKRCNEQPCPAWSTWSSWSSCSSSCGSSGTRSRRRYCQLLSVTLESKLCPGDDVENASCPNHSCPELGPWSAWSSCSVTCGQGTQKRERKCLIDTKEQDMEKCSGLISQGENLEQRICRRAKCAFYAEWSEWSECSKSCGRGTRQRERNCVYENRDNQCKGEPMQTESCNKGECPKWSAWSSWSQCSVTCGRGKRERTRTCTGPEGIMKGECRGQDKEQKTCLNGRCPVVTAWTPWSECSASCGGGQSVRMRRCRGTPVVIDFFVGKNKSDPNGNACHVALEERRECNVDKCDDNSVEWSQWGAWGSCDKTCGSGKRSRTRICNNDNNNNMSCKGNKIEFENCNTNICPPSVSVWSNWSACSASCNGGFRVRRRSCQSAKRDQCKNVQILQKLPCNLHSCPQIAQWSEWSQCSVTCGQGFRIRKKTCNKNNNEEKENKVCKGVTEVMESCSMPSCPTWSPWSAWSACSRSCGGGSQRRLRKCLPPDMDDENSQISQNSKLHCKGGNTQIRKCNRQGCPRWSSWSSWSTCSVSCGEKGGLQRRRRVCIAVNKNECPKGPDTQLRECNKGKKCPNWSQWSNWTPCSAKCNGGISTRSRECLINDPNKESEKREDREEKGKNEENEEKDNNKDECEIGKSKESRQCNLEPCNYWSEWTTWSECEQHCGEKKGQRQRIRECNVPDINEVNNENETSVEEALCKGDSKQIESCISSNMNCTSFWSSWTEWTSCSVTCGLGTKSRARTCLDIEKCDESKSKETKICVNEACRKTTEWSEWSTCSSTNDCEKGVQRRQRTCLISPSVAIKQPCKDVGLEEKRSCGKSCSSWSTWGSWSACSTTCNKGIQLRVRECRATTLENVLRKAKLECKGSDLQYRGCNEGPCANWSTWGPWGTCSATCGPGTKRRVRECSAVSRRNCDKNDVDVDVSTCDNECTVRPEWSAWSSCSVSCGGGGFRRRQETNCDNMCREQVEMCYTDDCDNNEWSEWSNWSGCSKTCGIGVTKRHRKCKGSKCKGEATVALFCNTQKCQDTTSTTSTSTTSSTTSGASTETSTTSSWSEWGSWSACKPSCGHGWRWRRRLRNCDESKSCEVENQRGYCTSAPCSSWSSWGPWSKCECDQSTLQRGTKKRERSCAPKKTHAKPDWGLLITPCEGSGSEKKRCIPQHSCSNTVILPELEECKHFGQLPNTFHAFNGKPARNAADCSWDFFACTKHVGKWPSNKPCCKARFDLCCATAMNMMMMPMTTTKTTEYTTMTTTTTTRTTSITTPPTTTTTSTTTTTTTAVTTTTSTTEPTTTTIELVEDTTKRPRTNDTIELIDCVWNYFGCIKSNSEEHCSLEFNACSMVAMGMVPPMEAPDFVDAITPIDDIDLPENSTNIVVPSDNNALMRCLARLYTCDEENCSDVELCADSNTVSRSRVSIEHHDCLQDFFWCTQKDQTDHLECRAQFRRCTEHKLTVDEALCGDVFGSDSDISSEILISHPLDCTQIFRCHRFGPENNQVATEIVDCSGEKKKFSGHSCQAINLLSRCQPSDAETEDPDDLVRRKRETSDEQHSTANSDYDLNSERAASKGAQMKFALVLLIVSITIQLIP